MKPRPYSLGYDGHAKACRCDACIKAWVAERRAAVKLPPRLPSGRDATVFVRGHFRRQPNHLRREPELRRAWRRALRSLR